jgi:DNA polymerase I-like protein with 3'-5' exonuclease and polymerase domains
MSDTDDIDDFLATLSTESAKAVPAKVVPKPKAPLSGGSPNLLGMVVASNDDDDGDDIAAFLETTGLKADREVPDASKPWMKYHKFTRVQTIQEVNRIVNECIDRGTCSLDLETTGLDNRIIYKNGKPETVDQIVGFCISYDGYEGFYIPIRHKPADRGPSLNVEPVVEVERAITRLCRAAIPEGTAEDKAADSLSYKGVAQLVIFFWNAQFDHEFLYPVTGIDWWHPSSFEDGMLASFVKYAGDKGIGLKPKAKQLLIDPDGNPYEMIELKQLFQKGMPIRFDSLSPDEPGVIRYGGSDGICTYKLCIIPDLVPLCNAKYNFTYRLEKQLTCVLRVLERNRVRINRAPVRAMLEAKSKERDEILAKIRKFAKLKNTDLDPNSPKQLGEFLFGTGSNCMNITPKPAKNEASGQYKTDGATLEALAEDPNAPAILKDVVTYRGFEKSIGTYLIGLANNPDANDELRVSFKQTGASTGRFSAPAGDPEHGYSGIPIHGIPQGSDLRRVFEARPGYTMAKCDYAGEELRIAANVSGETVWINEFMQGSGDLHTITARAFFGKQEVTKDERNAGKCVHPESLVFINDVLQPIKLLKFSGTADTFESSSGLSIFAGSKYEPITATYNGGVKTLVHVVTSGGVLTCTSEHQLKLRGGAFVRVMDLKPGALLEPVTLPRAKTRPYTPIQVSLWDGLPSSTYQLNHDWAYLAGAYAGDGTGSASSLGLTHGKSEKIDAYGHRYEEWIQKLITSCEACEIHPTRKGSDCLYLGSRVLVRLFQALDIHRKSSKAFNIPFWVLRAGRESILHYLGGLFDTDGTVGGKTPNLDVTTKDFSFAGQLATVLRYVGLDFNLELTYNQTYKRYYARLRLPVNDSLKLRPYLRHEGKKARLRAGRQKSNNNKDRFIVLQVLPAESGQCVDLSVSKKHVYVVNGILTHNTANFALLYGGGPKSIIRATGCNEVEARRRKQAFDKAVPTFAKWIKQQHAAVKINLGVWTAFGRWLLIPDANSQEGEIRAACERHSVNFQIQGAGADIMKIAMVLLHKAFHNKGWLRNGGDDSVRMLLTVHDEIVFEIKHERVVEVIPLIVEIMEGPWKRPKNPPWKVPLVVEPLVGFNWSSGYKVERHKKGQALGKGEVLANGYVYGTTRKPAKEYEQPDIGEIVLTPNKLFGLEHTPPWLASLVPSAEVIETPVIEAVQETPTKEAVQESQTKSAVQEIPTQDVPLENVPLENVPSESLSDLSEALLQVAEPQLTAPPEKLTQFPEPQTDGVIVFGIDRLNEQTAAQISDFVCVAMLEARRDGHGSILHLQDFGGETLIPISYNYRIQVSKFAELLRRHNLLVDK